MDVQTGSGSKPSFSKQPDPDSQPVLSNPLRVRAPININHQHIFVYIKFMHPYFGTLIM